MTTETPKRKPVQGKKKGNGFEREIANLLSARFEDLTGIKQSFRRNPDSGSFFGGSNRSRIETHDQDFAVFGDLICPKNFKWSVECKNYKSPPSLNLILNHDVKSWDGWIEQMENDAAKGNKLGMLVVKYNNTNTFVMIHGATIIRAGILAKFNQRMMYKNYCIGKLEDFLTADDSVFFDL